MDKIGTRCSETCVRPSQTQAHCKVCHRTFGGVSGFDQHRRAGGCLPPAELGHSNRRGVWRRPRQTMYWLSIGA